MYLLYLDESGGPNSWSVQKHFVLGGVAVHEGQVHILAQKLNTIQKHYFPRISIPIPFHATDIREGIGHFRSLQRDIRDEILEKVY
jgi:hypothetical protein